MLRLPRRHSRTYMSQQKVLVRSELIFQLLQELPLQFNLGVHKIIIKKRDSPSILSSTEIEVLAEQQAVFHWEPCCCCWKPDNPIRISKSSCESTGSSTRGRQPKAGTHWFDFRCDLAAVCAKLTSRCSGGKTSRERLYVWAVNRCLHLHQSCRNPARVASSEAVGCISFHQNPPLVSPALLLFLSPTSWSANSNIIFVSACLKKTCSVLLSSFIDLLHWRLGELSLPNQTTLRETLMGNFSLGEVNRLQWGVWGFLLIAL